MNGPLQMTFSSGLISSHFNPCSFLVSSSGEARCFHLKVSTDLVIPFSWNSADDRHLTALLRLEIPSTRSKVFPWRFEAILRPQTIGQQGNDVPKKHLVNLGLLSLRLEEPMPPACVITEPTGTATKTKSNLLRNSSSLRVFTIGV
jgi:hypothetical protein